MLKNFYTVSGLKYIFLALLIVPHTVSLTSQQPPLSHISSKSIIFPGGGIFFYWQAGVVTYLREENYPLLNKDIGFTGASAGALCATLGAAGVDFETATALALDKAREAQVWERPMGLYGIWGAMIDEWLEDLLPENDDIVLGAVNDKVSLLVTEIPSFRVRKISQFTSRRDLIEACLASVHIPLFLDGKLTTKFRNGPHIDGSFLAELSDYHIGENSVVLDWQADPIFSNKSLGDAVSALSESSIWDLLESGRKCALKMEKNGSFDFLKK